MMKAITATNINLREGEEPHQFLLDKPPRFVDEEEDYVGESLADILGREQWHELVSDGFLCEQTPAGQNFVVNTDDQLLKELMDQLTNLHKTIMSSNRPACTEATFRDPHSRLAFPAYKLTRLGKKVRACCVQFLAWEDKQPNRQQLYANHLFNPTITVMLRAMERWSQDIGYWLEDNELVLQGSPDSDAAKALQRLVKFVRRTCSSWAFKNEWGKHDRKASDNFRSGSDFIVHLFSLRARLLVLRIDFYIRPGSKEWGYSKEADTASDRFLRKLRDGRVVPDYLGSIFKRENGINRGMHWHWMVFLDGHYHRNAYGLTQLIGEAWKKHIGSDRGSYFNCYARRHRYRFNGLGLVHTSNTVKLLGMRIALWYMTKRDCVLRTDNEKHQDFRRSKLRREPETRRGAPRKNPDSLALVKRLLGGKRSKYPLGFDLNQL